MSTETATILPIIIAGLMNGSFVIPAKFIKNSSEKIWFYHGIIGLTLIPWIILAFVSPSSFSFYLQLPYAILFFILANGIVFGLGQIWFAKAIELLGVALSFSINLGIGLIIGSMFVIFYKGVFLTKQGFLVTLSISLILSSLILYYCADNHKQTEKSSEDNHKKFNYIKGWILASLAGLTSGLQNITFFLVIFHVSTKFRSTGFFWIWPPFLLTAAITMIIGFRRKANRSSMIQTTPTIFNIKDLFLITLMGLFFTGSLAFYSDGMSKLTNQQQIIGWPVFMVSIIFASQVWGLLFKEFTNSTLKNKLFRLSGLLLLIIAVSIFSI
jgi:L-rhamnose-H+ transport protein